MMTPDGDGYIFDIPYTRGFYAFLAPAWLDHVATVSGFAPPERREGFAWCELGCGQGVTAVVLAATHPKGVFHGIDAAHAHIEHAHSLAAAAGTSNIRFHAADFAAPPELPGFDYIVAHGVYSWVSPTVQKAMRDFIDRHLKPGGLLLLSYNAMPGWATDFPFQHLVRTLGQTLSGDSAARFSGAYDIVRRLVAAGVPVLKDSRSIQRIEEHPERQPTAYLAHEFMGTAWRPLWFSEVRDEMAGIGLEAAGSADLMDNYDSLVLGESAREMLSEFSSDDTRELVREFFLTRQFRRDVYIRNGRSLEDKEQRKRLMAGCLALARPPANIQYHAMTAAGRVDFDNLAARTVVDGLAAGPQAVAEIAERSSIDAEDLLANALVLCGAGHVRPVEPGRVPVARLNRALSSGSEGRERIDILALPCGTAVMIDPNLVATACGGEPAADNPFNGWPEFLAAHGLSSAE